jgi:hypothetical protein
MHLYRHPLPTEAMVGRRCMLVASAQRGGLYANLTRIDALHHAVYAVATGLAYELISGRTPASRALLPLATRAQLMRPRASDRAERTEAMAFCGSAKISSRTTLPSHSRKTCAPSWWTSAPLALPRPWYLARTTT